MQMNALRIAKPSTCNICNLITICVKPSFMHYDDIKFDYYDSSTDVVSKNPFLCFSLKIAILSTVSAQGTPEVVFYTLIDPVPCTGVEIT